MLEYLNDDLLVHAGAVARGDVGVMLPGASGRGKTTLVAALVARGFSYLSDEVAVVDPRSRTMVPFAKSLYVHESARAALLPLHPELAGAAPRRQLTGETVWYVTPRPGWLPRAPVALRHVILPTFVPDAPTTLVPISRSTALQCVMEQSFNLGRLRAAGVGALVAMLREVACHALTFGDLDDAVGALGELVRAS